jgi:hypothetical protein
LEPTCATWGERLYPFSHGISAQAVVVFRTFIKSGGKFWKDIDGSFAGFVDCSRNALDFDAVPVQAHVASRREGRKAMEPINQDEAAKWTEHRHGGVYSELGERSVASLIVI